MRDQDSVAVLLADMRGTSLAWAHSAGYDEVLDRYIARLEAIQSQQDGAQGGDAVLYAAAEKGFHISETCGPDGKYWHVSKFQSLADLQAYEHAWRDTMLAAKNQRLSRPAIAPQATPAAVDDGMARAAAYVQKKADDYAMEHCSSEPDTGAAIYHYGQAGEDYHHGLLELAEELAALAAPPAEVKP